MTAPRRPRHLLDPADLHGSHLRSVGSMHALTRVQRWVMSILVVTTILHLSAGMAIASVVVDDTRMDARIGLNALAAVTGVVAVVVGRLIHQKRPLSTWLLLGLVPGLVGAYVALS